jgi:protein-tyrosine phosphatase
MFKQQGTLFAMHFTDIHCHCLPGVDDGPATMIESVALCHALAKDGFSAVVATPHQLGRFSETNEATQIRQAVSLLNEALDGSGIDLTVLPGGDVRVDERICQLLEADKILTLADGGKYILLELPQEVFLDIEPLLAQLSSLGVQSIISHPERHPVLAKSPQGSFDPQMWPSSLGIPPDWFNYPIHLQITAGSLLGHFGPQAQRAGWHFLKSGLASLVATDCHDLTRRRPCMRAAFQVISDQLARWAAKHVCIENPLKVLKGWEIEPLRTVSTRMSGDESLPVSF